VTEGEGEMISFCDPLSRDSDREDKLLENLADLVIRPFDRLALENEEKLDKDEDAAREVHALVFSVVTDNDSLSTFILSSAEQSRLLSSESKLMVLEEQAVRTGLLFNGTLYEVDDVELTSLQS